MKSDIIRIDNQGSGFQDALAETAKAAQYRKPRRLRNTASSTTRKRCSFSYAPRKC